VEKTYKGPQLDTTDDGKYKITMEFIRSMIQWFKDGNMLPRRYAWEIVLGAHDHFAKEESLVDVKLEQDVTIDVIGDVHGAIRPLRSRSSRSDSFVGQFYDVLHLLSLTGEPSEKHILLMNGDLVDRGSWSVEVILTAFAFKCESVFIFICPVHFLIAIDCRAVPQEHVHQSGKSRSKRHEPDIRVRGRGEAQARRANIQGMSCPRCIVRTSF
jgi:hypothetical protein